MLWNDEFDSFDESKWGFQQYDGLNYGMSGWGNDELVWYTNRSSNAYVSNGNLVINAQVESDLNWLYQNCWTACSDQCIHDGNAYGSTNYRPCMESCAIPRCDNVKANGMTSAKLRTYQKFSVAPSTQYQTIRIEGKMDLPRGSGLWPAFWLLPEAGANDACSGCGTYGSWAASGEIDVMSAVNDMESVTGAMHYGGPWPNNQMFTASTALSSPTSNVFAIEWTPTSITWFLNGMNYSYAVSANGSTNPAANAWYSTAPNATPNAPFDVPFHLILDLSLGGKVAGSDYSANDGQALTASTVQQTLGSSGKQMLVDYVRVCGKPTASSSASPSPTAPSSPSPSPQDSPSSPSQESSSSPSQDSFSSSSSPQDSPSPSSSPQDSSSTLSPHDSPSPSSSPQDSSPFNTSPSPSPSPQDSPSSSPPPPIKPRLAASAATASQQPAGAECGSGPWNMLWEDEFDFFDDSKWGFHLYDGLTYGMSGWGNDELVWYTNRTDNAYVSNGNLVINAQVESDPNWVYQDCWNACGDLCVSQNFETGSPGYNWCLNYCAVPRCDTFKQYGMTSARLRTYKKFSIAPSDAHPTIRVEAKMDVPSGAGLWPAFWMLPEAGATDDCVGCGIFGQWAASGEIDIMEAVNNMDRVTGTMHYGGPPPTNKYSFGSAAMSSPTGNVFAIEWTKTSITWFLNGQNYSVGVSSQGSSTGPSNAWYSTAPNADANAPFDVPFHIILDLTVGGQMPGSDYAATTGQPLTTSTVQQTLGSNGKQMLVDFVRVCSK